MGQSRAVIVTCGTVPGSDSECETVLDSASEHGMYSMGTIMVYNLSDVTITNYGKFLILLMWAPCMSGQQQPLVESGGCGI